MVLVRSQLEHCSVIWRPVHKTYIDKIESLQKRCLKWILGEEAVSYSNYRTYVSKCRSVNLLPLSCRFDLNDLLFFHKILYDGIALKLPSYLKFYQGNSRLRNCHLDDLSLVSDIQPKFTGSNLSSETSRSPFANIFFYRTHLKWNALPREMREIVCPNKFKNALTIHIWETLLIQDSA